ncbi:PadR family transcriptional regulator [Altererythrobacter sp. MF3-039]|uniref:PadR family transcriptional regulator n=1 Tax=Altererythrobacter sp. MF3-039 TaxID=3252901 RepID=UPI00390C8C93
MTWNKGRGYGRRYKGSDAWPFIAMMAAQKGGWRGGWDDDDDDEWEGRSRRRKRRVFGQGELRLALLALIRDEPRHGYELIKAIEELTGGAYAPSPGAVYPTLQMLEDEGMIAEAESEGSKKPYEATPDGIAELDGRADEVDALMRRLTGMGEKRQRVRSPDLFRAMGNLATVLKNRAKAGKLDKTTIDEIVDIIDEVAKRIERL